MILVPNGPVQGQPQQLLAHPVHVNGVVGQGQVTAVAHGPIRGNAPVQLLMLPNNNVVYQQPINFQKNGNASFSTPSPEKAA